ncbi:carboxylesterase 1-like [Gastrolobium bilobum]|uniref:carboxylesterase 1-like n=1 Tax=Gastrolobium bilobum TaxID=150636 RepID=UPI002AB0E2DD|nr:carboxylesterase 1-like [Gastrolobium bilobum]XP_061349069.1 carboxylesterase 1-like [Gastrolobium bilobum]
MANKTSPPSQTIDPYQHLKIVHNPNDTLTRSIDFPSTLPSSDTTLPISVLTKDVTINQSNNTWLRLFLPRKAIPVHGYSTSNQNHKLPLIVYFHGSGFIITSAASTMSHDFCVNMAESIEAVVASVEYRLAPEHRLPAAYDDAMETLVWITSSQDEWLTHYVDYSNCYLMGSSAGATIAYYAGLRAAQEVDHLEPLKIQGLILRQPFFGGTKRSGSELRHENDPVLPLCVSDLLWELALPIGVDREHEYCNLRAENCLEKLDKIEVLGWRVLVSGNGGDPLVDREKELVKLMEEKGVQVVSDFEEEGCHGVEFSDSSKAKQLIEIVKGFISSFGA